MGRIVAWVVSIAVVALAFLLPRRVLTVLMMLALALLAVWTVALFMS